jgi:hypothetical protein
MLYILDYIILIFKKYNTFSDYFKNEIGNSITLFEFFNFLIFSLVLIILLFKFLIKTFGLKKVLNFIFIRLLIIYLIMLVIYISSDYTVCETEINKISVSHLKKDKELKTVVVLCGVIIGGYLVYKYLPVYVESLKSQKILLIEKSKFDLYKQEMLQHKKSYANFIHEKNLFVEKFLQLKNLQVDISILLSEITSNRPQFKNINDFFISKYIKLIQTEDFNHLNSPRPLNYYEEKIENNLIQILENMDNLMHSHSNMSICKLSVNYDVLIKLELNMIFNLLELRDAYVKYTNEYENCVAEDTITACNIVADFTLKVNIILVNILNDQQDILHVFDIENSKIVPEVLPYLELLPGNFLFSTDYIYTLKFFVFNVSYLVFYPSFFIFNKILGVSNPFTFKIFKESIWYFFTLKFIF